MPAYRPGINFTGRRAATSMWPITSKANVHHSYAPQISDAERIVLTAGIKCPADECLPHIAVAVSKDATKLLSCSLHPSGIATVAHTLGRGRSWWLVGTVELGSNAAGQARTCAAWCLINRDRDAREPLILSTKNTKGTKWAGTDRSLSLSLFSFSCLSWTPPCFIQRFPRAKPLRGIIRAATSGRLRRLQSRRGFKICIARKRASGKRLSGFKGEGGQGLGAHRMRPAERSRSPDVPRAHSARSMRLRAAALRA